MDRLNEILPYIEKKRCALFIGAGISKIAGCYDWNSLVKEMLENPVMKDKVNKDELIGKIPNEDLIDFCQREFTTGDKELDFWGIARRALIFDPERFQNTYVPLIKSIRKINPPPQIITTNIDNCLETTSQFRLNRIFYEPDDFIEDNLESLGIIHIHGYIERFKDWTAPHELDRYGSLLR